jgi:spermidine dehydrogenase
MPSKITRRDFIDGVACSVIAGAVYPNLVRGASSAAYPPALTGFRGSREPDYATAHAHAAIDEAYRASREVQG